MARSTLYSNEVIRVDRVMENLRIIVVVHGFTNLVSVTRSKYLSSPSAITVSPDGFSEIAVFWSAAVNACNYRQGRSLADLAAPHQ